MHQCPGSHDLCQLHTRGVTNDEEAVAGGRRMRPCDRMCQGLRLGEGERPRLLLTGPCFLRELVTNPDLWMDQEHPLCRPVKVNVRSLLPAVCWRPALFGVPPGLCVSDVS